MRVHRFNCTLRCYLHTAIFANSWFPFPHLERPFCAAMKCNAQAFSSSWPFSSFSCSHPSISSGIMSFGRTGLFTVIGYTFILLPVLSFFCEWDIICQFITFYGIYFEEFSFVNGIKINIGLIAQPRLSHHF